MAKLTYPESNRSFQNTDPDTKSNQTAVKGARYSNSGVRDKGSIRKTTNTFGPGNQTAIKDARYSNSGPRDAGAVKKTVNPYKQQLAKLNQQAAPKPTFKPARKPTEITVSGGGLRTGKSSAKATAPTRMAVNPATGNTTGFTSGKTTGSTVTKAGVATKTGGTAYQQMQRNAMEKSGVAGPRKDSSGRNVSSMTGKRK